MKLRPVFALVFSLFFCFGFLPVQANAEKEIVNFGEVYTYEVLVEDLKALKAAYPGLITVKSIGKTPFGRDIWAVKLGRGEATVLINGSLHAREWISSFINMKMVETYAQAYVKGQKIEGYDVRQLLDRVSLWFVPMVNPDGVTLQQKGLKAFPKEVHKQLIAMNGGSKNFERWKANAQGIDLNRHFPVYWDKMSALGVFKPWYKNFKGSKPMVAPETIALAEFTKQVDPEITVNYHSSGRILYWHYAGLSPEMLEISREMAQDLRKMTGYELVKPTTQLSGGFKEWFNLYFERPSFTPEVSPYYPETSPPLDVFPEEWKRNKKVGLYVAQKGFELHQKRVREMDHVMQVLDPVTLYEYPNKTSQTKHQLAPQRVHVLQQRGAFYQIETWMGPKWIRPVHYVLEERRTVPATAQKVNPSAPQPKEDAVRISSLSSKFFQNHRLPWYDWYKVQTWRGAQWLTSVS